MPGPLQAAAITRRFGVVTALAGVNFAAWPGEIHALLGENGAGKTTLMNVIAGHLRPDRGVVTLDGALLQDGRILFDQICAMAVADDQIEIPLFK